MAKPMAGEQREPMAAPVAGEQRELLANIIANPDDKKPRLVYADLLQERGDPRGEYIILQCTRAELADDDPRAAEIDAQCDALMKKHKKAWTALGENKGARFVFRRGFVEKLSLDADDLLRNADLIFGAEPIEELNIWKIDESKAKQGKSRLAPLLALPLQHIKRLSLARCKLTKEDFEALAAAKTLGNVEMLDLTNGGSATIPIAPLAKATSLPKLRELKLTGCMMGDKAIAELARSQTLKMKRLDLERNDFSAKACAALADAVWADGLEHLDLSSNEGIGDDGLEHLAKSTRFSALQSLKMTYVGTYDRAADLILSSWLVRVPQLDIDLSPDDHERVMAARPQPVEET